MLIILVYWCSYNTMGKELVGHKNTTYKYYNPNSNMVETYDVQTGKLLLLDGVEVSKVMNYTPKLGAIICQMVMSGDTLSDIGKMEGMPSLVQLYDWHNSVTDFRNKYDEAVKNRGRYLHDMAFTILKDIDSKKEGLSQEEDRRYKLLMSSCLKLSERDNPSEYALSKIDTKIDNKIQVIVTGVPNMVVEEDNKDDEYKKIVLEE